ncbi:MAG TPA: alpha/beta hydrolase [Gammaproteobacteria bacterium]|nr:alpha/beta hydrolase [Gammaproteobacteria bacterium]
MRFFLSAFCLLLLTSCSNLLFVPFKPFPVTPDVVELGYEDLFLDTDDGIRLHGWKLYAEGKKAGSIIFFHGNGDNISTQLPGSYWLAKKGYDVYVFDYRGYGQSEGRPDLDDTIRDMDRMIARSIREMDEGEKLVVMGHSLGGSMAVYVVAHSAHRDRIRALVTVEAFSDYHDITQETLARSWLLWLFQWPLSFTVSNAYSPEKAIGLVSPIPVLILHSRKDEMIDISHAEKLFQAAKPPKSFRLIDSGHNDIFNRKENRQVLLDYLQSLQ